MSTQSSDIIGRKTADKKSRQNPEQTADQPHEDDKTSSHDSTGSKQSDREARLAEALRANLRRRKKSGVDPAHPNDQD